MNAVISGFSITVFCWLDGCFRTSPASLYDILGCEADFVVRTMDRLKKLSIMAAMENGASVQIS
jgi:hypothetical protein